MQPLHRHRSHALCVTRSANRRSRRFSCIFQTCRVAPPGIGHRTRRGSRSHGTGCTNSPGGFGSMTGTETPMRRRAGLSRHARIVGPPVPPDSAPRPDGLRTLRPVKPVRSPGRSRAIPAQSRAEPVRAPSRTLRHGAEPTRPVPARGLPHRGGHRCRRHAGPNGASVGHHDLRSGGFPPGSDIRNGLIPGSAMRKDYDHG